MCCIQENLLALTWKSPLHSISTGFFVMYERMDSKQNKTYNTSGTKASLDGLYPGARYNIEVRYTIGQFTLILQLGKGGEGDLFLFI